MLVNPLAALKVYLTISLFFVLLLCAHSSEPRPNIILIYVDDMGYGDLSCYGGALVETPNIDSLTESGIRFTEGYTISPVCGPSRVGLLTGMQPSRIGVYWNPDMGAVRVPSGHQTLSELMKSAGYCTALVGKWNLNNPAWNPMPAKRYFDYVYDEMVWEGDYWPNNNGAYHGVEDGKYGSSKTNDIWGPLKEGDEYLTDRLSRHACEFVSAQTKQKPFFLYLSYNAPHSPLQGKSEHLSKLSHVNSEPLRLYASMLLAIDEGVGDLLDTLEVNAILEDTVILFVSDNGPARTTFKGMPEHWPRGEMLGSTAGLRGYKGTFYEGGVRVPYILSWPQKIATAITSNYPVTTLDIIPTLSSLAGASLDQQQAVDGIDLSPLISKVPDFMEPRTLLWFAGTSGAVRNGDWKLVYSRQGESELFNLRTDRMEQVDRSISNSEKYEQMSQFYFDWAQQVPPPVTPR